MKLGELDIATATVLVVDDEPSVAGQLGEGLEASGFRVRVAHQAADALEMVRAFPEIAVVVSDIRMPGGDGLQLARDIHAACPDERAVEVIVITGHATIEDAADAVRSRVSDFLRKPFRLMAAVNSVERAMARALERRAQSAEKRHAARRILDGEAQRDELNRRLEALTAQLAAAGGGATIAVRDKLHAVSHALRTPLNAISASADLLHGERVAAESPDYQRILQEGIIGASRAIELVEELILAEGKPAVAAAPTPVTPLVHAALARVSSQSSLYEVAAGPMLAGMAVPMSRESLARALDLAFEAALAWTPPSGGDAAPLQLRCLVAQVLERGRSWACITLVAGPGGTEAPTLPTAPVLEAQGTSLSRTLESLPFLVARHVLEQQGGRLTSMVTPSGHGVLRLALPLAGSPVA